MKIHLVGAELFHAEGKTHGRTERLTDRQRERETGVMNLVIDFRNFVQRA
jgi:hypothetical protein